MVFWRFFGVGPVVQYPKGLLDFLDYPWSGKSENYFLDFLDCSYVLVNFE